MSKRERLYDNEVINYVAKRHLKTESDADEGGSIKRGTDDIGMSNAL